MKHLILFTLFFFSVSLSAKTTLQQQVNLLLDSPAVKNAAVSYCVTDVQTNNVLLSSETQLCVVPASVQKLITSATALEILGGGFRFTTFVWAKGEISNRKLSGDLIITGGGDPTLGSENFGDKGENRKFLSEWVHWIKKAGIDTIAGNIIADPYIFSDQDVPSSWLWEDLGNHYGAGATGISVYDNMFNLIFTVPKTPGKSATLVKTTPDVPGLTVKNEVIASAEKSDNAYVFGSPFDSYRIVKGTLPAGSDSFVVKASLPDPSLMLASELKKALTDSSVIVKGNFEKQKVTGPSAIDTSKIVVMWVSPKLTDIVEQMNQKSINLYAETLLKQIGLTVSGEGSTKAGTKAIIDFWKSKGPNTDNLFMVDGSGLSRQDAITAQTLTDILAYMKNDSKWFDAYEKSIPLTGIDGTQQYYFQNSELKGKARAKTGSMTRVRSMAGYMTTRSGKGITFAIMINNYNSNSSTVNSLMEGFLDKIYNEL